MLWFCNHQTRSGHTERSIIENSDTVYIKSQLYYILFSTFLFLYLQTIPAFANTITGKIIGQVVNNQTGSALSGVNITLQGTSLGAASDNNGYYVILNILPGNYILQASFIGYRKVTIQNVRVKINRTVLINIRMDQTALAGQEIVIEAKQERVQTDVSNSQITFDPAQILQMPVGVQMRDVLHTRAGIELDHFGRFSIRGSRYEEVVLVFDGIKQNMGRFNLPFPNITRSSVQEIQVLTGGYNAEYGQSRAGIINIVTKEGSNEYTGSFSFRYRPKGLKHRGPNIYSEDNYWDVGRFLSMEPTGDRDYDGQVDFIGWKEAFEQGLRTPAYQVGDESNMPATPEEALEIWKWHHRGFEYGHKPDIYLESSLGGPLPFLPIKFFVSSFYNREMFPFPMIRPEYVEHNTRLKLTWDIGSGFKFRLLGQYSEIHTASHGYVAGAPEVKQGNVQAKYMVPNWDNLVYQGNMSMNYRGLFNLHSFPSLYDIYRTNLAGKVTWIINPRSLLECQLSYSSNRYRTPKFRWRNRSVVCKVIDQVRLDETPYDFWEGGDNNDLLGIYKLSGSRGFADFSDAMESFINIDWLNQVTQHHQIKLGAGFTLHEHHLDYGVTFNSNPEHVENKREWIKRRIKESELFFYTQDKVEYKGFVLNLGLRLDQFQPLSHDLVNDFDENLSAEHNYYDLYELSITETRGLRNKPESHWVLSPRIGVSHPVGQNSKLFFNYGYFYQRPIIHIQYGDIRHRRGPLLFLGNPRLNFSKTIAYEMGIEQNILKQFLLRISAYYKDVARDWGRVKIQSSRFDKHISYTTYLNNNYADIRGIELNIEKSGRYFTGVFSYEYRIFSQGYIGQNTYYADPEERIYRSEFFNPVAESPVARPRMNLTLMASTPSEVNNLWLKPFSNLSLTMNFYWRAGRYFTYHGNPLYPGTDERNPNNVRWKNDHRTNLRIEKSLHLSFLRVRPFLEIRNLFDYNYFYLPEGSTPGFAWSNQDIFKNYMDWIKLNHKTPGDHRGVPPDALPHHWFLLMTQPRDFCFGIDFDF